MQENVERAYEKFYLVSKTETITKATIRSLCISYIKGNGQIFKLISLPFRSEIYILTIDDVFEIHVFHKPFYKNPSALAEVLNYPHEVEIENYLTCEKIYDAVDV